MLGDTFVIDGVVHVVDFSMEHMGENAALADPKMREAFWDLSIRITGGMFPYREGLLRGELPSSLTPSTEANYQIVFGGTPTDMAIVGCIPFGDDQYVISDYTVKINHAFAKAYPERTIFCGGVDPHQLGLSAALDSIEYQVKELGAQSMKFYPFDWRPDDERIAYPMYEKCRSLGIKVLQFHLCLPGGSSHNVEVQRPNGLQNPARDFPDMTFIMHHPMPLYFDETLIIASLYPNIHLLISPLLQQSLNRPRLVQKMMGDLLMWVGSDKLIYGTEGSLNGPTTRYTEAMMNFEIAQDLLDGYGYPQITENDKKKILGLNIAKLFDIDVEAKKKELAALAGVKR